jgi:hypothetical protein
MPNYWCFNLDRDAVESADPQKVLKWGLEDQMCLMQWQYEHNGGIYQSYKSNRLTVNWMAAARMKPVMIVY